MYKNQIASLYIDPKQVFSKDTLYKAAKSILSEKFQKGIIDEDNFNKAMQELDALEKGGEGSKGGKVIGHTKSGKPIYDVHSHPSHKDFSSSEHDDASDAHSREMDKVHHDDGKGLDSTSNKKMSDKDYAKYQHHRAEGNKHNDQARDMDREHYKKMSNAEKVKHHTNEFVNAKLKGDKHKEDFHRKERDHYSSQLDAK